MSMIGGSALRRVLLLLAMMAVLSVMAAPAMALSDGGGGGVWPNNPNYYDPNDLYSIYGGGGSIFYSVGTTYTSSGSHKLG
jgi:hypothetical protein